MYRDRLIHYLRFKKYLFASAAYISHLVHGIAIFVSFVILGTISMAVTQDLIT